MKVKEESEKPGLKLNIQTMKIMASSAITSWQIDGKKWTRWWTLFSWTSYHCRWWLHPWNEKTLAPWKKSYDKPDILLKCRDITLPTKVHLVNAMVLPVVMYGCESWTPKKVEHQRIDASEQWYWRRFLRIPYTARKSKQWESSLNIHWKDWC